MNAHSKNISHNLVKPSQMSELFDVPPVCIKLVITLSISISVSVDTLAGIH